MCDYIKLSFNSHSTSPGRHLSHSTSGCHLSHSTSPGRHQAVIYLTAHPLAVIKLSFTSHTTSSGHHQAVIYLSHHIPWPSSSCHLPHSTSPGHKDVASSCHLPLTAHLLAVKM
ncbi:hypothetical protein BsWGS_24438 [Bradybaena similaris]